MGCSTVTLKEVVISNLDFHDLAEREAILVDELLLSFDCKSGLPVVKSVASPRRSVMWRETNQVRKPPERQ